MIVARFQQNSNGRPWWRWPNYRAFFAFAHRALIGRRASSARSSCVVFA
jgi:hypothetical protein